MQGSEQREWEDEQIAEGSDGRVWPGGRSYPFLQTKELAWWVEGEEKYGECSSREHSTLESRILFVPHYCFFHFTLTPFSAGCLNHLRYNLPLLEMCDFSQHYPSRSTFHLIWPNSNIGSGHDRKNSKILLASPETPSILFFQMRFFIPFAPPPQLLTTGSG